jgi:hypothetical protein
VTKVTVTSSRDFNGRQIGAALDTRSNEGGGRGGGTNGRRLDVADNGNEDQVDDKETNLIDIHIIPNAPTSVRQIGITRKHLFDEICLTQPDPPAVLLPTAPRRLLVDCDLYG